jgi:protein SCO1
VTRAALTAVVLVLVPVAASAQRQEPLPKELEGVGITEKLDDRVPLDLEFLDEAGNTVPLRKYFDGSRPVMLTLNYYSCPMLCTLQLNGLIAGLQDLAWTPGREFEMVTVSINPLETPELARLKKQTYLEAYGRPGAAAGWHFLVGREDNIKRLAAAVGFGYRYNEQRKEYAHAAAVMLVTPDGRLARYLYGVEYPARTLRLGLAEAGEGVVGTAADQFLLYCFHYDAKANSYVMAATTVMQAGGLLTVLLLGGWLLVRWVREGRRGASAKPAAVTGPSA